MIAFDADQSEQRLNARVQSNGQSPLKFDFGA